jgi:hypothetical protein
MRSIAVLPFVAAAVLAAPAAAGTPSFAPYASYDTGTGVGPGPAPVTTVARDFDGDGDADVATVSQSGFADAVLLRNAGNGTVGAPSNVAGSNGSQSLAAGDVDGDGDNDLVGMTPNSAIVLRNNGSGAFTVSQTLPLTLGAQIQAIVVDTDADRDLDIAAPTFNAVQTLRNNGSGTFAAGPSTTVPGAFSLTAVAAARLNGDAVADLLVADGGSGVITALLGTASGTFTAGGQLLGAGFGIEDVGAADLDGDGFDDAVGVGSFSFTLATGLSNGSGGFKSPLATLQGGGPGPTSVGVADLDGDGREDLAVSSLFTPAPEIHVYGGNGTVKPALVGKFRVGITPQNPAIADYDNDGRLDVATAGPGKLYVLLNTTP